MARILRDFTEFWAYCAKVVEGVVVKVHVRYLVMSFLLVSGTASVRSFLFAKNILSKNETELFIWSGDHHLHMMCM